MDTNDPPLRLGLGNTILPRAREAYAARLATWEAWEGVSSAAMGEPRKTVVPWIEQLIHSTQTSRNTADERFFAAGEIQRHSSSAMMRSDGINENRV